MSRGNIVHTSYSFLAKDAKENSHRGTENTEKKIFIVRRRIATEAQSDIVK